MLDAVLATPYGVPTEVLNQALSRDPGHIQDQANLRRPPPEETTKRTIRVHTADEPSGETPRYSGNRNSKKY